MNRIEEHHLVALARRAATRDYQICSTLVNKLVATRHQQVVPSHTETSEILCVIMITHNV